MKLTVLTKTSEIHILASSSFDPLTDNIALFKLSNTDWSWFTTN